MTTEDEKLTRDLGFAARGRQAAMALDMVEEELASQTRAIISLVVEAVKSQSLTAERALVLCTDLAAVERLRRSLSNKAIQGRAASERAHGKPLTGNGEHA